MVDRVGQRFVWYPPAETRVRASALLGAFRRSESGLAESLRVSLGSDFCVLGCSGRALMAGLFMALRRQDGGRREEVLIPGYTCYSLAASIVRAGLKIRAYDLDPHTLEPETDSVRESMGTGTLAVVVQHLFGIPTALKEVFAFACQADAWMIEDAAQGLGGSTMEGVQLGTQGDFGLFSFGRGKPLPLGCGGALVGRDEQVMHDLPLVGSARGYGCWLQVVSARIGATPLVYGLAEFLPLGLGETRFDPHFRMGGLSPLMDRLGVRALPDLEELNAHRRKIAALYGCHLPAAWQVTAIQGGIPVYTRFPVLIRNAVLSADLERLGVRRMYPRAIVDEPAIKPFLVRGQGGTPGAARIADDLLTLPTHRGIDARVALTIIEKLGRCASAGAG